MTQETDGRAGAVFTLRMTTEERAELEEAMRRSGEGPRAFGPWLLWRAMRNTRARGGARGNTVSSADHRAVMPAHVVIPSPAPAVRHRVILDLCAGSGSWSEPYKRAGYKVVRVTLPKHDVRTFAAPRNVWGVLAAPPCEQFSIARNGHSRLPRDFANGLEVVGACLRIIYQARPVWWALENPKGLLAGFLGAPADRFEPCDFGDPWTKATFLWGRFNRAKRHHVKPVGPGPFCTVCNVSRRRSTQCSIAAHRAVTPPAFAEAFFRANP